MSIKEHPVLLNADMVNAILSGKKTQIRQVIRRQPDAVEYFKQGVETDLTDASYAILRCYNPTGRFRGCNSGWFADADYETPFSKFNVGHHIWIKESFADLLGTGIEERNQYNELERYAFAANCPKGSYSDDVRKQYGIKWKPALHMPREASRILLKIKKIRIERLHGISRDDAIAEGFIDPSTDPLTSFMDNFKEIYGHNTWNDDPWLWVLDVELVKNKDTFDTVRHDFNTFWYKAKETLEADSYDAFEIWLESAKKAQEEINTLKQKLEKIESGDYVLVPKEPNAEILEKLSNFYASTIPDYALEEAEDVYKAMIEAVEKDYE